MDIWIVIDRYDHSEQIITAHLTKKGALIEAWNILIESYDNCIGQPFDDDDEYVNELEEEYPVVHKFIKQHRSNISEAKTADLSKYIDDVGQWVGEHSDWQFDVSIQTTRMQA